MSQDQALKLYSGRDVPSSLAEINAGKLLRALEVLGERHVLKTFVGKLEHPQQFILKGN